jgi:hypothetical protein
MLRLFRGKSQREAGESMLLLISVIMKVLFEDLFLVVLGNVPIPIRSAPFAAGFSVFFALDSRDPRPSIFNFQGIFLVSSGFLKCVCVSN